MSDTFNLDSFYEEFFQDVVTASEVEQVYKEEKFFEFFTDALIDAGEFDEAIYTHYQPARGGIRIDGYCGSPNDAGTLKGVLSLITVDFNASPEMQTLTNTEISESFKRAQNFVIKSLDEKFRNSLEETDPGYGLADLIYSQWKDISKIRFYLISNRKLSERAQGKDTEQVGNKQASYAVWDIERLFRISVSGNEREKLFVDFNDLPGGPLRALKASADGTSAQIFLAAVPGAALAEIYDRWGTRLLEQNVRVFLQARSSVNKGIKRTLEDEPQKFLAFNNGITATAEQVNYASLNDSEDSGIVITSLDNLQIVNGGQTTASVYAAYMKKVDLSKVFVQMKLCLVNPRTAKTLVPEISQSANSQNKVSVADFFSNHPYHIRIEELSRTVFAPSKEGSFVQSKWFYERARGQYRDMQAYLTYGDRNKFLKEYPKEQCFTKTDLAKYLMVWTDRGFIVNRGAQKNFAEFAKIISSKEWEEVANQYNDHYFKELVAKKIIFNEMEKLVPRCEWYEAGGYRSQHVVLAIGAIAGGAKKVGKSVDFETIWAKQSVSPSFLRAMRQAAYAAHEILMNPQGNYHNISEWAKQEECWKAMRSKEIEWDNAWLDELVEWGEIFDAKRESTRSQRELSGIQAQTAVLEAGSAYWKKIQDWMIKEQEGTPKELSILNLATRMSANSILTPDQCEVLVSMMTRMKKQRCPYSFPPKTRRRIR